MANDETTDPSLDARPYTLWTYLLRRGGWCVLLCKRQAPLQRLWQRQCRGCRLLILHSFPQVGREVTQHQQQRFPADMEDAGNQEASETRGSNATAALSGAQHKMDSSMQDRPPPLLCGQVRNGGQLLRQRHRAVEHGAHYCIKLAEVGVRLCLRRCRSQRAGCLLQGHAAVSRM